jgi:hypothetical protein
MMNSTLPLSLPTSSALQMFSALSDRVTSADVLGGGLAITFENGKTAVYSAALLKQMFQHAREITGLVCE